MKRGAVLLCAFAALCLCGVAAAHGWLMGTADQVSFRETALFGDIAAADGLTLTARQSCNRQLYWDSAMPVAAPGLARTEFTARSGRKPLQDGYPSYGVKLYLPFGGGSYDFGTGMEPESALATVADWNHAGSGVMTAMVRSVMDRTEAGALREETLLVRDYAGYLPLGLEFGMGGSGVNVWWNGKRCVPWKDESGLTELFYGAFRIPVPEDAALTVMVAKNERGMVTSLKTDFEAEESGLDTVSLMTEGKCWFAPYSVGEAPLDLSGLRDGYGLYCMPFVKRAQRDEYGSVAVDVDAGALHNAFPIAQGETPVELYDGGDGSLLLLLRTDAGLDLAVLDAETERVRQRMTLFDNGELGEDGWVFAPQGDGRLYTLCASRIRYYERGAEGSYTPLLDVPGGFPDTLPGYRSDWWYPAPEAAAWDGERLAVATAYTSGDNLGYSNTMGSLLLLVFDKTGLRYGATLSSAMMRVAQNEVDKMVFWGENDRWYNEDGGIALSFDSRWSAEETAPHAGVSFKPDGRASHTGAIIGGADGPTAVYVVSQSANWLTDVCWAAVLLIVGAAIRGKKNDGKR